MAWDGRRTVAPPSERRLEGQPAPCPRGNRSRCPARPGDEGVDQRTPPRAWRRRWRNSTSGSMPSRTTRAVLPVSTRSSTIRMPPAPVLRSARRRPLMTSCPLRGIVVIGGDADRPDQANVELAGDDRRWTRPPRVIATIADHGLCPARRQVSARASRRNWSQETERLSAAARHVHPRDSGSGLRRASPRRRPRRRPGIAASRARITLVA